MESFVKDKERRHDDVSRVFGWTRIVSLKQAKVDDGVGPADVELQEDRSRCMLNTPHHTQQLNWVSWQTDQHVWDLDYIGTQYIGKSTSQK